VTVSSLQTTFAKHGKLYLETELSHMLAEEGIEAPFGYEALSRLMLD
jgi:hypothetical protein